MNRVPVWAYLIILLSFSCIPAGNPDDAYQPNAKEQGTENGPCYPNKTCMGGLACYSEICVNPGAGGSGGGTSGSSGSGGTGATGVGGTVAPGSCASALDCTPTSGTCHDEYCWCIQGQCAPAYETWMKVGKLPETLVIEGLRLSSYSTGDDVYLKRGTNLSIIIRNLTFMVSNSTGNVTLGGIA
ncbi:MAG: hypothetical protein WCW31_05440, partial [Patescibacteria group bacterium]